MDATFTMVATERIGVAELLEALDDSQWNTASLCAGWSVREVAAHLCTPFSISVPRLILKMVPKGFDYNKVAYELATKESRSNPELILALRENAENRFTPPGSGPEAPLTDVVIHAQDIARPLGLTHAVPAAHANIVLDFLVTKKGRGSGVKKGLLEGLSLTSMDTGWTHGEGAPVQGNAAPLLMALAGRSAALDELSGDGVSRFRDRLVA